MEWLIPYPGDWHILKNFQPVVLKIFGYAGLGSISQKAGVKEGTLRLVSECTNFKKKKNKFFIQCYFAIIRLKISAFSKSDSMTTEMSGAISSLLNLLLKFKNTGEDKKSDSFTDMQTEISAPFLSLSMYDKFSDYCVEMAEADDTWKFFIIFTDNILLPYLLLWYANWNFRVAAIMVS